MSATTEPSARGAAEEGACAAKLTSAPPCKRRFALILASAGGLGYLPKAPGTWGASGGALIAILVTYLTFVDTVRGVDIGPANFWTVGIVPGYSQYLLSALVAGAGVWAAGTAARHAKQTDPQFVVIDEVSGQLIAYFFPFAVLNWKSWLLGFILFRVFDIWKPFPARQAESLPGGWGIMADDWVAGIYAGIGLWLARVVGL
jgi:phosphatidylglycerophosphatase A